MVIPSPENRIYYINYNPDINTDLLYQYDYQRSMLTYEYAIVVKFKNTKIYQNNVNDCKKNLDSKNKLEYAYNYIISFLANINILDINNIDNYFRNIPNNLNEHEKKYEYVYNILNNYLYISDSISNFDFNLLTQNINLLTQGIDSLKENYINNTIIITYLDNIKGILDTNQYGLFFKRYLELNYKTRPNYNTNLDNLKNIFDDFIQQTEINVKNSNFVYLDTEKLDTISNYNFDNISDFSTIEEIEIIKLIIVEIFKDTKYYTANNITVNTIENIKLHIHSILKKKLETEKINYNTDNVVINKIDNVIKNFNDIFNSSFSLSTRDNIITFLKNIIVYFKYVDDKNLNINSTNQIYVSVNYLKQKLKITDIIDYCSNISKLTNNYISSTILHDVISKITLINNSADVRDLSNNLNNLINFLKNKANENNITISFDKPIIEILSILYNYKKLYEKYTNLLNNLNKLNDKFLNITTKTLIQQPASAASASSLAPETEAVDINKNIKKNFEVFYELLGYKIVFNYKYDEDYLKNQDKDFKKLIRDIYEDNKLIEDTSDLYLFLIIDQFYLTQIFKLLIENSNLKELLNKAYDLLDIRINDEENKINKEYKDSISNIKKKGNEELKKILQRFEGIKQRIESGQPITRREKERFKRIIDELESEKNKNDNKEIRNYIDEVINYINTKNLTEKVNDIDESLIIEGYKKIIDFSSIASMFKIVVMFLILLCVFLYLFVLFISVFNVFNLIVKIIFDIIQIFYNKNISNNETLLYNIKSILNCSRDDYSQDILNVLNEQSMSLSVFNTTIYIIYILVFYALIYLLFRFYALMKIGHKFIGHPKDIDPDFELLIILGAILGFSIIHYIYYKIIFKELSYNNYNELHKNESEIDELISKKFNSEIKDNQAEFDNFFDILKEPSRRNEIDIIISDKVLKLNNDWVTTSDLLQYLLIYNIYLYFEDNIILNTNIIKDINTYLTSKIYNNQKEKLKNNTFISFLDANERKLIKKYHEQLPFYETIPDDKLNYFIEINKELGKTIGNINKKIIGYNGSFYPFLFACIYIITICIFNFICVYVIMGLIANAKNSLPEIIINIANKYLKYCDYILSFIVYKER
jgi:hypothetical protein